MYFNPLPLYRGRLKQKLKQELLGVFQSTPSLQRETLRAAAKNYTVNISIHSLFTEGDKLGLLEEVYAEIFQSTPSLQRETHTIQNRRQRIGISIHSLFTEGDVERKVQKERRAISIHSLFTEGD